MPQIEIVDMRNRPKPVFPEACDEAEKARIEKQKAAEKAKLEKNVVFGGRLGTYSYLNMDQVIQDALNDSEMAVIARR